MVCGRGGLAGSGQGRPFRRERREGVQAGGVEGGEQPHGILRELVEHLGRTAYPHLAADPTLGLPVAMHQSPHVHQELQGADQRFAGRALCQAEPGAANLGHLLRQFGEDDPPPRVGRPYLREPEHPVEADIVERGA